MAGYAMLQNATKVDLQKSLAELTAAMQQLATKDQLVDQGTSTQPGPAGSGQETGSDTKVLVDFEKVTVDTYRITNGGQELPLVPGNIRNMLRDFTFGDLRDLLSIFGNLEALTSPAFHRTLESYGLAIKKLQHEKILSAEHVKKRDATTIYKLDAGPEISDFICEHCKSPWLKQQSEGKCLACGKIGSRMHKMKDMGMTQEVLFQRSVCLSLHSVLALFQLLPQILPDWKTPSLWANRNRLEGRGALGFST